MAKTPVSPPAARRRRTASYWEPIYDPADTTPFPTHDWDFQHNRAPAHVTLSDAGLQASVLAGRGARFNSIRFVKCDFFGLFDLAPREIVFYECTFEECDFGLTTWKRAKFTRCTFVRSSFSQSNWTDCEFRACKWKQIGLSGNATDIKTTIITNPAAFVGAAYTNLDADVLKSKGVSPVYQDMRLQMTKATLARSIVRMMLDIGDEGAYYDAVKLDANASITSKMFERAYEVRTASVSRRLVAAARYVFYALEYAVLNAAGAVNAWGRSVGRPVCVGAVLIAIFALIYSAIDNVAIFEAAIKSADITLLAGYTAYSGADVALFPRLVMLGNMLIGVLWYIVFVPTLVNRISRVR